MLASYYGLIKCITVNILLANLIWTNSLIMLMISLSQHHVSPQLRVSMVMLTQSASIQPTRPHCRLACAVGYTIMWHDVHQFKKNHFKILSWVNLAQLAFICVYLILSQYLGLTQVDSSRRKNIWGDCWDWTNNRSPLAYRQWFVVQIDTFSEHTLRILQIAYKSMEN